MISNSNIQYFLDNHICDRKKIIMFGSGSFTGVDSQRFKRTHETETAGKELRRELDIPGSPYVIGFVGRLVVEKGIRELMLAWQQLKSENPQLHMIIVAPPEIGPGAEAAVNCLRSDNNVHFTGFMPDPVPAYAAMNCLVLPSYSEGFPCVLLEAACFELPTVATNVPGCIDAVVEGQTGWLVEARDENMLVDAIRRTYREPDVARQLGENARTRAVAEFSQELMWFGYAELFDVLARLSKSKWRSMLRSPAAVPEHLS